MQLNTLIKRCTRGITENRRIYLLSTLSLSVAFLCLAAALLAITNLAQVTERWNHSHRMTIYLRDGARTEDIQQLKLALAGAPELNKIDHLTSQQARAKFLRDTEMHSDLAAVPDEVFPATLEIRLVDGISAAKVQRLARRIKHFPAAEDVETYAASFKPLQTLLATARNAAAGLALLVILCVIAVIANTVRLAVNNRSQEIRILKLCGATDAFIRSPLLLEGAVQGFAASVLAILCLGLVFVSVRGQIDGALFAFTGVHPTFLSVPGGLLLIVTGTMMGALGSLLSVRRHLVIAS